MNLSEDTSRDLILLASGGALGFLASVLASVVFSLGLRSLRPKIDISKKIALDDGVHKIKLINKRRRNAVDVDVRVWVQKQSLAPGPGKRFNQQLKPIETRFRHTILPAKNWKNKRDGRARYARLVRLDEKFREIWKEEGEHYPIVVVVFARDEVSGVGKTFEAAFGVPARYIKEGYFDHGNSTTIISD